jgi:hypothetical protein
MRSTPPLLRKQRPARFHYAIVFLLDGADVTMVA